MALAGRTSWEEEEAAAAAASELHQAPDCFLASALAGLATISMAVTLAVREPPPGLGKNTYLLAVAGAFFAGVAEVITAAVCVSNNDPRARCAAGKKLVYASVAPLATVVGLSVASLLW